MLKFVIAAATAALLATAVAPPASAGLCISCGYWNGVSLNGVDENGLKLNGLKLNGVKKNGSLSNGGAWQDTSTGATGFAIERLELPPQSE